MDWIAACDALDHQLHASGVPDDLRMKAVADVMTALCRMNNEVERRRRDAEAATNLHLGWRMISERHGVCKSAVYKSAKRGRTQSTAKS